MNREISMSEAPYGLMPVLEHIGFSLVFPLNAEINDDGATFLLKNDAHILFRRRLCKGARVNIFGVEYIAIHWIINSNGYIRRPDRGLLILDNISRSDGSIVHKSLIRLMAA